MKKIIATTLLSSLALFAPITANAAESKMYAETAIVTQVDYAEDTVTVTTFNGNQFEFYGCEDWFVGDISSLLMDNSGTEAVTDDIIIQSTYSGHISSIGQSETGFMLHHGGDEYTFVLYQDQIDNVISAY